MSYEGRGPSKRWACHHKQEEVGGQVCRLEPHNTSEREACTLHPHAAPFFSHWCMRLNLPYRQVGIRSLEPVGVHLPGDQNYPGGGPFDPLGLSGDSEGFVEQVCGCLFVYRYVCMYVSGCARPLWYSIG